jgi:hypothetical protein
MGKLVQVATETVTSPVASVTLTGIDSDDVYMLAFNNIQETVDNEHLRWRVTESGTPNTTANYDWAGKGFNTSTTFFNQALPNQTHFNSQMGLGTATGEVANGICYIYNAYNSSEYTFVTLESSQINRNAEHQGTQGGGVFTSASQVNGLHFYFDLGNISGGTFTLYKVL